jgi:hypothetical protein
MVEPNNGQDRFAANRIVTGAPKLKRHNAKLCPLAIRERIVNALAAGDSKRAIARALRVSNNTVAAVAEQEWQQVETRKARIAAQAERAAARAFERINDKLDPQMTFRSTFSSPSPESLSINSSHFAVIQAWSLESSMFPAATFLQLSDASIRKS